jgi:hypothetical protein
VTETDHGETDQQGVPRDASSIVGITGTLESDGYTAAFSSRTGGRIRCDACGTESDASVFTAHQFRRLEGASDPEEMLAVAALVCPVCDARGVLVLTYGPLATEEDAEVLARLDEPPPPRPGDVGPAEQQQGG